MPQTKNAILGEMTELADEIFFIYDPHLKRLIYVNKAFEEVTKINSKALYENPHQLLDLIHPEDVQHVRNSLKKLAYRETNNLMDFRIIRPDNVERWLRLKTYPIMHKGQVQHVTGIVEDDSARKASILNMQKINGWKDSILDIIAHDLKGPIGLVQTLASAIGKHLPEDENNQSREWLKMIDKISKRNLDLIRNMLTKEALNTVGVELNKERLDLVWEINEIMHIFIKSQVDSSKQITFTYSHEHVYAQIDSMKFLQIVNNLVSNSIKFTYKDGKISVHLEKLDDTALVTVQDDGIGIPKKLQPALFDKRSEAARAGLNGEESAGLGMWIVKSLTEAHGGRVWFESEERKGTKVYAEFPLGN